MEGVFAVPCARFGCCLVLACLRPFWDAGVHTGVLVSILGCRYCTRIWIPVAGCRYKTVYQDVEYVYLYWDAALEMEYKFPFQDADPVLGFRDHTRT